MAKLNIGSGRDFQVPGFINYDMKRDQYVKNLSICGDARHLPFKPNTIDEIMSYHLIEHVGRFDLVPMLKDWLRVLKRGGKIAVECPDFDGSVRQYLEAKDDKARDRCLIYVYGWQPIDFHYNGLNEARLIAALKEAGYSNIRKGNPVRRIFGPAEPLLRMEAQKS